MSAHLDPESAGFGDNNPMQSAALHAVLMTFCIFLVYLHIGPSIAGYTEHANRGCM